MKRLAVFASGSGTNAENLVANFNEGIFKDMASVELIVCNKPDAYVLKRAEKHNIHSVVLDRAQLCGDKTSSVISLLKDYRIDVIILAGYLLQIPRELIELYPEKIINIHPALLPSRYGGKGMYGERVHRAVLEDKAAFEEKNGKGTKDFYSGITIHIVDEEMDHGRILFQSRFILSEDETLESLEEKIHVQEQADYPRVVAAYLKTLRD